VPKLTALFLKTGHQSAVVSKSRHNFQTDELADLLKKTKLQMLCRLSHDFLRLDSFDIIDCYAEKMLFCCFSASFLWLLNHNTMV